jgi:hypothetical protein
MCLDFGNSWLNTPTITDLGDFGGTIGMIAEDLEIFQVNGQWYGFMVSMQGNGR